MAGGGEGPAEADVEAEVEVLARDKGVGFFCEAGAAGCSWDGFGFTLGWTLGFFLVWPLLLAFLGGMVSKLTFDTLLHMLSRPK